MCILFLKLDPNPPPDGYAIIIANNRDEYFNRPTKPADFWLPDHPTCIGGIDLERPGYGTWLGASRHGKIASLLNILEATPNPQAQSRGGLVTNFLSCTMDASSYMKSLQLSMYNRFRLVLLENRNGWHLYTVSKSIEDSVNVLKPGVHVFNNSEISDHPWRKAIYGRPLFENILKDYSNTSQKDQLVEALQGLLSDDTRNLPDPVLEMQGAFLTKTVPERVEELSCVCVKTKTLDYGTRTKTVILVDGHGHCHYVEKTMKEPINGGNPYWSTTVNDFQMNFDTGSHL